MRWCPGWRDSAKTTFGSFRLLPSIGPLLLTIKTDDWVYIIPGVLFFMTFHNWTVRAKHSLWTFYPSSSFFFFSFSFYKATWDTFASGLEVEMTPRTQWLLSCDFKDTRKHNKRGHVWVHWRNHSLGWLGMGVRMGTATLYSQWSLFV